MLPEAKPRETYTIEDVDAASIVKAQLLIFIWTPKLQAIFDCTGFDCAKLIPRSIISVWKYIYSFVNNPPPPTFHPMGALLDGWEREIGKVSKGV